MLEWHEDEGGALHSDNLMITEINGRYELSKQVILDIDGWESIGWFATEDEAKEVANNL
jgi:hypothetical protein